MANGKSNKDSLQNERELIYLLLHQRSAIDYFLNSGLSKEYFNYAYRPIVTLILQSYDIDGVLLTPKSFRDKIKSYSIPRDRISQEIAFNACFGARAEMDNLPLYINKILEGYVQESIGEALNSFRTNSKAKGHISAIKDLADKCNDLLDNTIVSDTQSYFNDIRELSKERTQYIADVRSGKIEEEPPILSGIREIDYTMVTGFEKGTLTLFCADVGVYKSTMILNIALNVWKSGYDVLFVPLEMHRDQMWRRACSREARLESEKITKNVKNLTDEEFHKIEEMNKTWDSTPSKFFMMQEPGYTTVGKIGRQVERNIELIEPKLVVIDYVANLAAERQRYNRNDLEIGDMLKAMRQMGKDMNFAVLSAAQLGREALKRLRKTGANRDKASINSEDIRGSHEYAADADNIYAQLKNTSQPNQILDLFAVKSRNGPTTFADGKVRAILEVYPQFGLIKSPPLYDGTDEEDDIMGEQVDDTKADKDIIRKSSIFEEADDIYGYSSNSPVAGDVDDIDI